MRLINLEFVKNLTASASKVKRDKLYIFLVCFGISVFIWLMIKLSGEYYSNVSYPFRFTNVPSGKLLVENVDSSLNIKLKANGMQLFNKKFLTRHSTILIDLEKVKINRCRYSYGSYILTSTLTKLISKQLKFSENEIRISPDSLFFVLENSENKMICVKPDLEISFKKQFQQYGDIVVSPDSILLSGSFSMIDTINFIKTKKIKFSDLSENTNVNVEIVKPLVSENIKYSAEKVNIKIPVENYTESSLDIPIQKIGDSLIKIKTFPGKVKTTSMVALKDFDRIDKSMFMAAVDCSKISEKNKIFEVKLLRQADFVNVTGMFPEKVEYIILK